MAQHTGFSAYSFNSCPVRPTVLTKLKQRVDHTPTELKSALKVSAVAVAAFNAIMPDIAAAFADHDNDGRSDHDIDADDDDDNEEKKRSLTGKAPQTVPPTVAKQSMHRA